MAHCRQQLGMMENTATRSTRRRHSLGLCVLLAGSIHVAAFTTPQPNIIRWSSSPSSIYTAANNGNGLFSTASNTITENAEDSTTTTSIDTNNGYTRNAAASSTDQRRSLGSQELLMLPRQYRPKLDKGEAYFPSMSHVQVTTLSGTPSLDALSQAIELAMDTHPLLRCFVEGDGEPSERIDLFQMVRKGEPNPCTFVAPDKKTFTSKDVLHVVEVNGSDIDALEKSWKANFVHDLDDGSWYAKSSSGPLWKLTLHRLTGDGGSTDGKSSKLPCALVFSSNHAISDQSSVNVLMDQILADIVSIENDGRVSNMAVAQELPMALEDSVLGKNSRWSDIQTSGISSGTIKYVADKAAEGFRNPVILPDSFTKAGGGDSIGGAVSTIMGKSAGGESDMVSERRTVLQTRSLSVEATSALLEACRANGVSISNALIAAMALTATDFIDSGDVKKGKKRNYKVLQSLDMRRFGAQLDKCETGKSGLKSHIVALFNLQCL
jgi:hypothetical protein